MATTEIKFTRANLSALPTPAARTYYKDPETRGLLMVVWPNGTKAFELYRKVEGKPTRIGLGHFDSSVPESRVFPKGVDPITLVGNSPSLNVAMARLLSAAVNAQLDIGTNPAEVKRSTRKAKQAELTLQGAFDRYEKDYLIPKEKRTTADLRNLFDRNLGYVAPGQKKPHGKEKKKSPNGVDWSKRKLSDISASDVLKLHNSIKEASGGHTANRVLQLLRAIFNKMILWKEFKGDNPCEDIELFEEHERERYIQEDELPRFFAELAKVEDETFRDYISISLFSGARRENVLGMRWKDIDFATGLWTIAHGDSKNKSSLTVHLTAPSLETLQNRKAKVKGELGKFVFPAISKSGHMSPPKKPWAALLKSAGIDDLRLHDLRRTLGSWSANTGASLHIIGKALGHKSMESTLVYARLQGGAVKSALDLAASTMMIKGGISTKEVEQNEEDSDSLQ